MSNKETYSQALERIYSEDHQRVGNKDFLLQMVQDGNFSGVKYEDKPQYWQASGVSKDEFDAAQARGAEKKRARASYQTLTGGKP
ncbi:hypothetical protein [Massilia litorea]|uniref:Uncharacterized protein n=1 Tax=Massilia litorea TaxID=2769491 RepID=A0A7L9U5F6_9BURK|nr:hypothetical protein [Massilia litorea]QOL50234.1 hypothetical protein LPB04_02660 [Massilia litorea]